MRFGDPALECLCLVLDYPSDAHGRPPACPVSGFPRVIAVQAAVPAGRIELRNGLPKAVPALLPPRPRIAKPTIQTTSRTAATHQRVCMVKPNPNTAAISRRRRILARVMLGWHGPTPCCQSTSGNLPCQRGVGTGNSACSAAAAGVNGAAAGASSDSAGGAGRTRSSHQDRAITVASRTKGVEAGTISAYMCIACRWIRATWRAADGRCPQWGASRLRRDRVATASARAARWRTGQVPALMRQVRPRRSAKRVIDAAGGSGRSAQASPRRTPWTDVKWPSGPGGRR